MNRCIVSLFAFAFVMLAFVADADAQIFGRRRGCSSGCNVSCGSGSSQGCKIDSAPTRAAEAADLFKEDAKQDPPVPPAPPLSKIKYTKESALALVSAPRRLDIPGAVALVSAPRSVPKALLASR
jgi:hypothetical protein